MPIGDIAAVAVDGGYLVGTVYSQYNAPGTPASGGSFFYLVPLADGGWSQSAGLSSPALANVAASLSLAPPGGSIPTTMMAGACATNGTACSYSEMYCAQPFDGDGGPPFAFEFDDAGANAVGKLRVAQAPGGQLGFVVDNAIESVVGWGVGPADGGCPTSVSPLPALPLSVLGTSTPSDSAIAPLPKGGFAIAEAYFNDQDHDVLALFSVPAGQDLANATFGTAASVSPTVAIASDGANLSVFASDLDAGVLVFGLDGGSLQQVTSLSPGQASSLESASCGKDCTVVGWTELASVQPSTFSMSFLPKYAVVNGEGCGLVQSFPEIVALDSAPVAVAASPEGALFAYALDAPDGNTQLLAVFCGP